MKVLDIFDCKCIYEPRGDYGLEGFQLNQTYVVELVEMKKDNKTKKHYRIYLELDYYETCGSINFKKCFAKV